MDRQGQVIQVPPDQIDEHPGNAIYTINEESIKELAASIRIYGVLQELKVKRNGNRFLLISGHRRLRAAIMVGLKTVPCIVVEDMKFDGISDMELLIEHNRTTRERTIMDKAREIRETKNYHGVRRGGNYKEKSNGNDCRLICERLNISERTFRLYDKLNDLIPELQEMVDNNLIKITLASKIGGLPPEVQKELFEYLGDDIKSIDPGYITKLKEQNDRGYLVLEVMQKKLNDLESELQQRRKKDGDIADLERRIQVLRSKKKTLEYDLADYVNANNRAREQIMKNGAALLSVVEELIRPISGARPKIDALLETPIEPASATHIIKWSQVMIGIGQKLETAAKKALVIQGGKSGENETKNNRRKPEKTKRRSV